MQSGEESSSFGRFNRVGHLQQSKQIFQQQLYRICWTGATRDGHWNLCVGVWCVRLHTYVHRYMTYTHKTLWWANYSCMSYQKKLPDVMYNIHTYTHYMYIHTDRCLSVIDLPLQLVQLYYTYMYVK